VEQEPRRAIGKATWSPGLGVATFGDACDRFWSDDGQPGSYAGPQVCNRTNEVSLTPQKSAWGKCTDLSEIRFRNRGRPTTPNWDDQ
jgi:hypothetical protein